MGLIVDNVHVLGDDIVTKGCSKELMSREERFLIEDDPENPYIKPFCQRLFNSHEGFAPIGETITHGSVSSSHFNHLLCIGVHRVPTTHTIIGDTDGKVCSERLFKHPYMKEASVSGLEWVVLKHHFIKKFPRLPHFIQLSKNVVSGVAKGENAFQGLMRITQMVDSFWTDGAADMAKIARILTKSGSSFSDDIPAMCDYVRVWGGGRNGIHVKHPWTLPAGWYHGAAMYPVERSKR